MPRSPTMPGAVALPPLTRLFSRTSRTSDLRNALASKEHQLQVALHQIDLLRMQRTGLEHEVRRLGEAHAHARRLAFYDPLTGLPNRSLLQDRFGQAVALAARQGKQVAMLFFDVDRFKSINDKLGHEGGDRLLQEVATRLCACLRTSDTACRYGGDEFVVLLPDLEGRHAAVPVADKILATLAAPYAIDGDSIELSASVGIAFYPDDGTGYGELIRVSDRAMYRNKRGAQAAIASSQGSRLPVVDERPASVANTLASAGETSLCNASGA